MIRTGTRDSYIVTGMQLIMVNLSGRSDARINMTSLLLIVHTEYSKVVLCKLAASFHRLHLKIIT